MKTPFIAAVLNAAKFPAWAENVPARDGERVPFAGGLLTRKHGRVPGLQGGETVRARDLSVRCVA